MPTVPFIVLKEIQQLFNHISKRTEVLFLSYNSIKEEDEDARDLTASRISDKLADLQELARFLDEQLETDEFTAAYKCLRDYEYSRVMTVIESRKSELLEK